jgi:Fe-S cluster assembly scaffold protein SufB
MLIPLSEDERLTLMNPRTWRVEAGGQHDWSEVTVIGKGERRAVSLEIQLEPDGQGQMVRLFEVSAGARLTIFHHVRIEEGAAWKNIIAVRGAGEVKIRRTIEVFGKGAKVKLACLGVMEKTGRISVADEIFSYAEEVQNDLRTKIVLKDAAHSEARARIVVGERSHGSNSSERLDHLLLGDETSTAVIPELDVQTDDVLCRHGATTSRPGEGEMFYLTSRGLSKPAAEQLLARGFLQSALVDLPESVRDQALQVMFRAGS